MFIESEYIFKENLKRGINLFLGSGFSVLALDIEGNELPCGNSLLNDLKDQFSRVKPFDNLSKAAAILESTEKYEFYKFLIKRLTVNKYNILYESLFNIKINNIYSVNIDDLIYKIYENSNTSYISDSLIRGSDNNQFAIPYHPLHGTVRYPEKGFIFSQVKIASAYSDHSDSWQSLRHSVESNPVIFWGWSFNDTDVIEAIYKYNDTIVNDNINKWILLSNPKDYEQEYFKSLNFNIINGNTEELLNYFHTSQSLKDQAKSEITSQQIPVEWQIPKPSFVPSYPIRNFFEGDSPQWSYIFSLQIPRIHYFKEISDLISAGENILITGIPASGKSTLLMQLAYEFSQKRLVTYFNSMTEELAKHYLKLIKDTGGIVFIDNCLDDYEVVKLITNAGIQLIGCDRDDRYENLAFILNTAGIFLRKIDISEINDYDAQKIIDSIPNNLIKEHIANRQDKTIFDILRSRIDIPKLERRISEMITTNKKRFPIPTELFLMICYAHSCGIPVSFDMIFSYCKNYTTNYKLIYKYINEIGNMVKDALGNDFQYLNDINFEEQDYYKCRTRYMAELILDKIRDLAFLRKIVISFFKNIPEFKICRFDIFKRKAFDADLMVKLFSNPEEGESFYKMCLDIDSSAFICQQAALYLSRKHRYKEAFKWIEDAKRRHNSFSIENTHAIIMFNANLHQAESGDTSILPLLYESMDILKKCFEADRRKGFHAKIFADQAIKIYEFYGFESAEKYLIIAFDWLDEVRNAQEHSYRTKKDLNRLYNRLKDVLGY